MSHILDVLAVSRLNQVINFGGNTPAVRPWSSQSLTSWHVGRQFVLISDAESDPVVKVVYYSALAALTKSHRLGALNHRNLFSHDSGGWKAKTELLVGLVSSEASLLGL